MRSQTSTRNFALIFAVQLFLSLALLCPPASATDQAPGQRFHFTPDDLPPPNPDEHTGNGPRTIDRPAGATLQVPPGFRAEIFAKHLIHARWMVVVPNGDVFLAEPRGGHVVLLRDSDGDGEADRRWFVVEGLNRPHGLALHGGYLYVADLDAIWRVPYRPGETKLSEDLVAITAPGALGRPNGHWTRNIVVSPDGKNLYAAIGSASNVKQEAAPRATVQKFDIGGGGQETFATGLRNPVGIAFYPGTDDLYVVVNERDAMGDGLVPDYLTRIEKGDFFGWPYAYIGPNPQPGLGQLYPDLVAASKVPDVLIQSHSAPLGLVFYDGTQFPADYHGDAFVALHGSWNANVPRGYKIVQVPFENGRPTGEYVNFATGFWHSGEDRAEVWGRPAGLALWTDGSLLIADDVGQVIWRISYVGE